MSVAELAPVLIVAVLALWVYGARNRLVRLRQAVHAAWGRIDEQLRRRGTALPQLVEALRAPLAGEPHALDAVVAALAQAQAAAELVGRRPVPAAALAAFARADAALAAALERLLALLDQHGALREQAAVAPLLRELHDADLRIAIARAGFNDAAAAYNAAIGQFPTRLLRPLLGFGPALHW
jgi:LemA protein